ESERRGPLVGAEAEQAAERDDVSSDRLSPRGALELAELLERIDPDVRVGADADADATLAERLNRREPVAEVRFGGGTQADPRSGLGDEVELRLGGVSRVDDRR